MRLSKLSKYTLGSDPNAECLIVYTLLSSLPPLVKGAFRSKPRTQLTATSSPPHGSSNPRPLRGALQVPALSKCTGIYFTHHRCPHLQMGPCGAPGRREAPRGGGATLVLLWESARKGFKEDKDDFQDGRWEEKAWLM